MPANASALKVDAPDIDSALAGTLSTSDQSPPLTALSHIGVDVDPDEDTIVVAAVEGRIKVEFRHAGDDGRLWIGVGQAAAAGAGNFLDPGDFWSEFTADAVNVLLVDASTPQNVAGMEWAT